MLPKFWWSPLLCIGLLACNPQTGEKKPVADPATALAADGDHMVSINAADAPAPPAPVLPAKDKPWPELLLENGKAWVSCGTDYAGENGDGTELTAFDRASMDAALERIPTAPRSALEQAAEEPEVPQQEGIVQAMRGAVGLERLG